MVEIGEVGMVESVVGGMAETEVEALEENVVVDEDFREEVEVAAVEEVREVGWLGEMVEEEVEDSEDKAGAEGAEEVLRDLEEDEIMVVVGIVIKIAVDLEAQRVKVI